MTTFNKLTDQLAVAPQITVADVAAVKAAGYRSIVCHRPDGEVADQPTYRSIADAAMAAGLEVRYQPVVSGRMTATDVADFAALLHELPGPVFAYCRSGTRSSMLWAAVDAARG